MYVEKTRVSTAHLIRRLMKMLISMIAVTKDLQPLQTCIGRWQLWMERYVIRCILSDAAAHRAARKMLVKAPLTTHSHRLLLLRMPHQPLVQRHSRRRIPPPRITHQTLRPKLDPISRYHARILRRRLFRRRSPALRRPLHPNVLERIHTRASNTDASRPLQ